MSKHFLDELNSATSFWQKLCMTVLLVVFGVLVAPLLWLGSRSIEGAYARPITLFAVDTIAVYYVTLLVYLWWRPGFLRRFYQSKERKLAFYGYLLGMGFLVFLIVGAIQGLSEYFSWF